MTATAVWRRRRRSRRARRWRSRASGEPPRGDHSGVACCYTRPVVPALPGGAVISSVAAPPISPPEHSSKPSTSVHSACSQRRQDASSRVRRRESRVRVRGCASRRSQYGAGSAGGPHTTTVALGGPATLRRDAADGHSPHHRITSRGGGEHRQLPASRGFELHSRRIGRTGSDGRRDAGFATPRRSRRSARAGRARDHGAA